jgi:hypothetical protein
LDESKSRVELERADGWLVGLWESHQGDLNREDELAQDGTGSALSEHISMQ